MKPDRVAYNKPQYTAVVLNYPIISHNNINEHASVVENKVGDDDDDDDDANGDDEF